MGKDKMYKVDCFAALAMTDLLFVCLKTLFGRINAVLDE
jgi:hypothetical protein